MPDPTLFNIEDYTDERVRSIMQGNTCRHCAHRVRYRHGNTIFGYCAARPSGRTSCKLLKVKANQPACILFTSKDNAR